MFEIKSASLENEVQQSKEERERNKYVLCESKLFQWWPFSKRCCIGIVAGMIALMVRQTFNPSAEEKKVQW